MKFSERYGGSKMSYQSPMATILKSCLLISKKNNAFQDEESSIYKR